MNEYSAAINKTFELLKTDKSTEFNNNEVYRNFTIFVGVTGSGKSTLVQFLRDNRNLTAVKGNTAELIIVDGNDKIGDATTISKTFYPEFFVYSDAVLVDLPGFSDTRSVSHDIATTYLTRRALALASEVKIVLTCPHHAVRHGVDRSGLTDLLDHVANFLQQIDKYDESIGLVVTKVENQWTTDDAGKVIYDSDEVEIQRIGEFFKTVIIELQNREPTPTTDGQLKLLGLLTQMQDGVYRKIEIFRRPRNSGPIHGSAFFKNQKKKIGNLLKNELDYTDDVSVNDFGLTISSASKLKTRLMIETLDINTEVIMKDLLKEVKTYCFKLLTNQPKSYEWQSVIMGYKQFLMNLDNLDSNSLNDLPVFTVKWLNDVGVGDKDQVVLKLVENVSRSNILRLLVHGVINLDLQEFKFALNLALRQINSRMLTKIRETGKSNYQKMIDAVNVHYDHEIKQSNNYVTTVSELTAARNSLALQTAGDSYDENAAGVTSWLTEYKIFIPGKVLATHFLLQDYYRAVDDLVPIEKKDQLARLSGALPGHLQNLILWQSYIGKAFEEVIISQLELDMTDKANMKNWEFFKQKVSKIPAMSSSTLGNKRTISKREQTQLDEIFETALSTQNIKAIPSDSSTLEIRGAVIRLSDVAHRLIDGTTTVHIFALHTFLIDTSMEFNRDIKEVYIIAPIWHCIRQSSIGFFGNGGHLVGVGGKFENDDKLTVNPNHGVVHFISKSKLQSDLYN
jgi:GTP-binding protein EngB required for normal cell division